MSGLVGGARGPTDAGSILGDATSARHRSHQLQTPEAQIVPKTFQHGACPHSPGPQQFLACGSAQLCASMRVGPLFASSGGVRRSLGLSDACRPPLPLNKTLGYLLPPSSATASSSAGFSPYRGAGWRYSRLEPGNPSLCKNNPSFDSCVRALRSPPSHPRASARPRQSGGARLELGTRTAPFFYRGRPRPSAPSVVECTGLDASSIATHRPLKALRGLKTRACRHRSLWRSWTAPRRTLVAEVVRLVREAPDNTPCQGCCRRIWPLLSAQERDENFYIIHIDLFLWLRHGPLLISTRDRRRSFPALCFLAGPRTSLLALVFGW